MVEHSKVILSINHNQEQSVATIKKEPIVKIHSSEQENIESMLTLNLIVQPMMCAQRRDIFIYLYLFLFTHLNCTTRSKFLHFVWLLHKKSIFSSRVVSLNCDRFRCMTWIRTRESIKCVIFLISSVSNSSNVTFNMIRPNVRRYSTAFGIDRNMDIVFPKYGGSFPKLTVISLSLEYLSVEKVDFDLNELDHLNTSSSTSSRRVHNLFIDSTLFDEEQFVHYQSWAGINSCYFD
jgi:hypothetical protein